MCSWFLVHQASKTHWATRIRQLLLSSNASCTSSHLIPIFLRVEILADDSPPVLTWTSRPSPETIGFPMTSLTWDPVTFHAGKMFEPPQSAASDNVFRSNLGSCPSRKYPGCFAAIYGTAASSLFIWVIWVDVWVGLNSKTKLARPRHREICLKTVLT